MAQKNDQVFQLSLTEIAFTISFILLLLLGYLIFQEQTARKAAVAALVQIQISGRHADALREAQKSIVNALKRAGASNPDEVITKLVAADDLRAERDRLKQQVEDLDSRLTALTELRNQIEKAANSGGKDLTRDEVESAVALQEQVRKLVDEQSPSTSKVLTGPSEERRKNSIEQVRRALATSGELKKQLKTQLNRELLPGKEVQTVTDVVAEAKSFNELERNGAGPATVKKENADLRGQLAFLKNKLDARGGRDFPPCWADEKTGKVEFLFAIEVRPDSVAVVRAWPPSREVDAQALPGIVEVLSGTPHSNSNFVNRIQGIFNKSQKLQCRHYVQLKSSIADAVQSDRARLMVENYFYKTEVRR